MSPLSTAFKSGTFICGKKTVFLSLTMKNTRRSTTLYCFSPLVMISTFSVELLMAVYMVWRYRLDSVTRLVAATLICLAVFQWAEYMICEGALGLDSLQWARIGYVAITLLPPLGIHLGMKLARKTSYPLLAVAYGSAIVFGYIFLFAEPGMQAEQCLGNYVIFHIAPKAVWPYVLYYYSWLAVGVFLAFDSAAKTSSLGTRRALKGLGIGYLVFIVPTIAVALVDPSTMAGIPSIMCGFAVIFAAILTFWVVPAYKTAKR